VRKGYSSRQLSLQIFSAQAHSRRKMKWLNVY
jgi:hypothetical protein